jgi:tetratricopeptide (TPR) repeat protein
VHILVVGGSRSDRLRTALAHTAAAGSVALNSQTLPFQRTFQVPSSGLQARIDDIEAAFPNQQARGTRLILTQSTYLLQRLVDAVGALAPGPDNGQIVATADRAALERNAPEAFYGRGPWRYFELVELPFDTKDTKDTKGNASQDESFVSMVPFVSDHPGIELLAEAYASPSIEERFHLCNDAVGAAPGSAVAALAFASACRERQEIAMARAALDRALELAPDWEAVHYEDGKFWLAHENMQRARDAFRRAGDLMPTFSAAFGNLGATLGELDQAEAALAAFTRALASDPDSFTVLNNIGVVNRELGRLDESAAACRRVVEIAPDFVFGHYNLGHTLFLAGRFPEALAAYEEGQQRDPEKNRRQGCRLAIVRFANGDVAGAERDLRHFAGEAAPDERADLLLEAYEIAQAIVSARPHMVTHQPFLEKLAAATGR